LHDLLLVTNVALFVFLGGEHEAVDHCIFEHCLLYEKELLIRGQENQLLKGVGGLTDTDTTDVTSHILLLLSNKNACPVFFNYLGWLFCWCLVKAAGYLDPNVYLFATWFFMLMIVG